MRGVLWAALVTLGCAGCESNPTAPAGSSATASASAAGVGSATATASPAGSSFEDTYTDDQLPVPGDFEDAAAKAVTKDNYKAKLAELEAAVGGPPAASASAPAASASAPAASASAPAASGAPPPSAVPAPTR